ncbi:MAG TPA: NAD(P)-binding domain-containing protein [Candidatus Lumbricidophila sp.]|nr:NAD(P)-binding domain-containing protein [Candidatus Lumbricidophila sp.]
MKPTVAVFGPGKVGAVLAALLVEAGFEVRVIGSHRAVGLGNYLDVVAPGAVAVTASEGAAADIVLVAVPFHRLDELPWSEFTGRIVVDATNYWPAAHGLLDTVERSPLSTSELVAARNPAMHLVKSLNHLGYHELEEDHCPAGSPMRRAIAVAGDQPAARAAVARLIDAIGFDPVDIGPLAAGRVLEPGHPLFGRELTAEELRRECGPTRLPTDPQVPGPTARTEG